MDADARALEEAEGVTPGMVYVCAVRVVAGYARLLPQFMAASLDTGRLAAPLPPRDLVPDLIDLLAARPPPLAPKTLATLLQVHAAQTLPEQSARVLTAMLARASVFDGCEHEVQWWIKGVPASASVIVALTNLVGMAIKSLYSMLDLVVESMDDDQSMDMDTHGEEDDEQIPPLPFSPLAAALVVTLSDPTAHALDPPAVKFLLTVLARIHASLPDPAPLERLLASRGLNLADLPDLDVVLMGEPALMVAKALQPLSHGGDIPLAFAAVATIVGEQPDAQTKQAATLATVGHPRFASIVARDPEEAAAFVVQVAPILLRDKTRESELVAPVLAAFKAALTTEAAEPAHFTATTTVYKELSALLDLQSVPVDAFAPESWLVLLPVLAHVPASVSQSLFASTQVTALLVEVMRNALLPNFPLPGSVTAADDKLSARTAVRDGTSALDMEMVPVTVVDRVASLRPTTAAATDVLTILAAYSPLHFERLLSLLEAAAPATEPKKAMPNPHYAALIRATAVAETRAPYQVKWRCDDEARERVLRVITKATGLVAADDMVVAAVAMDAHLAQQQRTGDDGSDDENDEEENSRSPRRLALNLPSAVAAWRWAVASGDEHVCAYAKEAARLVANALARGESVPAPALLRLFVYATQQAVDEGVMLPGTLDVVEFSTALVSAKQSQRAAVQYFASWLPQMRTELTPVLLGRVLASVMAVASGTSVAGDARVKLLKCAESIMRTAPSRFCLQEYLLALLSMYRASLHPRDQAILRILHLYESRAATNLGQMMMFWGEASATAPAGGAAQRTFDESIALIDPERMARTVRYFPIHLELALPTRADDGEDEEAAATTTTVLPDAAYLYDPRFMLPLTLKYLEQGNGLDLRYFLDRNLVALGVAALGSQHASMRRAGLAILDEYYTLIVTSKLKNKPIVYATLDLLRHQITSRDPENPTRLPVLITTFVGQAMTLLIHPEYDAYEPVQLALLSRPFLDLDGVPGVQDMLTASANGRHRAWMLGLLHAGARSARDVTTILMRHVLDNLQAYAASHAGVLGAAMGASGAQARGMLHVALHICVQSTRAERAFGDAELASASERAVYGTGLLPFLQHQVEGLGLATTASHRDATAHTPATLLLAVARAMAVLKARTAVQQSHAATIAASCLSTLATIATTTANDSPSMSPALWLNMLDAVAAVAPTVPAVQATAHWALSEIETVTPANKLVAWAQLPASDAARVLSIEARVVLAPEGHLMDALERVDSNVGDLYRSVTRRLAPHCRSMRKRAIAVLGDTDVFIS
ncbi:hypothetical protein BC828DRAFT_380492 [Blastocladiella britannica]|nr:hypothetical protein BC828DRAFT_380492 [Blastocladiella britannica]